MYELNQTIIPEAFMALYSRHGRPTAPRAEVEARFELCEDMAQQLSLMCAQLALRQDLQQAEILQRCWAGLRQEGSAVTEPESNWVVARTAELLEWPQPAFLNAAAD